MRKPLIFGSVISAVLGSGIALAEMPVQKAEKETQALMPIAADMTWTGRILPDVMGKGSPELATSGKQDCRWELKNLWLTCEVTAVIGKGKEQTKAKTIFSVGYDYGTKQYRAVTISDSSCSMLMNGQLEGNKLTLTSVNEEIMNGKRMKVRMAWDWTNPREIKWTSEHAVDGGEFRLGQEAVMKTTKKERPSPSA